MLLKIKAVLAKILVNNITGFVLAKFYSNNIPFHNLKIDLSNKIIKKKIAASLFFKTYESAEIRFISKYLQNYQGTIVEFGASIGVVSTTLAKANPNAKLISFEADSRFISIIENNFKLNGIKNGFVYNEIIGAQGYEFSPGEDNTMGKISKSTSNSTELSSFSNILMKYSIDNEFVLICDIEGAEYFVLNEDVNNFNNCPLLIMELHPIEIDNNLITVEDLKSKIEILGYKILEQYGSNIVAKKR